MALIALALVTAFVVGSMVGAAFSRRPAPPAARSEWRRTTWDPPGGIDA